MEDADETIPDAAPARPRYKVHPGCPTLRDNLRRLHASCPSALSACRVAPGLTMLTSCCERVVFSPTRLSAKHHRLVVSLCHAPEHHAHAPPTDAAHLNVLAEPAGLARHHGRGLHSFTLELNLSNSRTESMSYIGLHGGQRSFS